MFFIFAGAAVVLLLLGFVCKAVEVMLKIAGFCLGLGVAIFCVVTLLSFIF